MKRANAVLRRVAILACLGVGVAGLAMPTPAQAKGVHLSIGIGIPFPIAVVPGPIVMVPAPVVVYPPPIGVYRAPVLIRQPYFMHPRGFPPGLAKKDHGYHPTHGYKFYKKGKHHWQRD